MGAPSSLRHFFTVGAMGPLQYQKNIRLHEARVRRIADAENVAGVGFDVGYGSSLQFRRGPPDFDVPPGEDMKRTRTESRQEGSLA